MTKTGLPGTPGKDLPGQDRCHRMWGRDCQSLTHCPPCSSPFASWRGRAAPWRAMYIMVEMMNLDAHHFKMKSTMAFIIIWMIEVMHLDARRP